MMSFVLGGGGESYGLGINEYKWIEEKDTGKYLTNLTAVTQLGNLQNVYNHNLLI